MDILLQVFSAMSFPVVFSVALVALVLFFVFNGEKKPQQKQQPGIQQSGTQYPKAVKDNDPHFDALLAQNAIFLRTGVGGFVEVVGESNYQDNIRQIPSNMRENFWVQLSPEPTNPHDKKAIAVLYNGLTLGYLSREEAREFHKVNAETLGEGRPIAATAKTIGGSREKPSFGILLDFDASGKRYKRPMR